MDVKAAVRTAVDYVAYLKVKLRERLRWFASEILREDYVASVDACRMEEYLRLGLTDSGILHRAATSKAVAAITTDVQLCLSLLRKGIQAININHLRQASLLG